MSSARSSSQTGVRDFRLYVPYSEGWEARVKHGWEKEYCYYQNPGEEYFHLILSGEIYLQHGNEKCCLNCAVRQGIVSFDRLNWQRGKKLSSGNML